MRQTIKGATKTPDMMTMTKTAFSLQYQTFDDLIEAANGPDGTILTTRKDHPFRSSIHLYHTEGAKGSVVATAIIRSDHAKSVDDILTDQMSKLGKQMTESQKNEGTTTYKRPYVRTVYPVDPEGMIDLEVESVRSEGGVSQTKIVMRLESDELFASEGVLQEYLLMFCATYGSQLMAAEKSIAKTADASEKKKAPRYEKIRWPDLVPFSFRKRNPYLGHPGVSYPPPMKKNTFRR